MQDMNNSEDKHNNYKYMRVRENEITDCAGG